MMSVFLRPFTNAPIIYLPGQRFWKTVCCAAACEGNDQWPLQWILIYVPSFLLAQTCKKNFKKTFSSSFDISYIGFEIWWHQDYQAILLR